MGLGGSGKKTMAFTMGLGGRILGSSLSLHPEKTQQNDIRNISIPARLSQGGSKVREEAAIPHSGGW